MAEYPQSEHLCRTPKKYYLNQGHYYEISEDSFDRIEHNYTFFKKDPTRKLSIKIQELPTFVFAFNVMFEHW